VTIERVREETLAELLPLVRRYCDFYEVSPSDEALLALSRALIADPEREGVQLLAREGDGNAIGFATIYWSWATTSAERIGVMNDLYVAPEARGSGAAEALIDACRAECANHGARKLTWQTAPDNDRAQKVYDRVGATKEQWVDYWLPVARGDRPVGRE
jgi:ribosomal protein S18 acetylase RimI-like enzyme